MIVWSTVWGSNHICTMFFVRYPSGREAGGKGGSTIFQMLISMEFNSSTDLCSFIASKENVKYGLEKGDLKVKLKVEKVKTVYNYVQFMWCYRDHTFC